jgi:hypothetical protein
LPNTCHTPLPFRPPWFDPPTNIWWGVWITKLLIIQSSPVSHYFFLLRPKHRPQDSILAHPQPVFFP